MEALVRRELLILDVDPRSPERGQYRFLQGVVREVAYQSLARKNRQSKHLAAARYFESQGEEELAAVRATHYLAAHQATPAGPEANALAAQARVALRAAADRAAALHDLAGAHTYLEQAITVTSETEDLAALHERALVVAGSAARFARAHEHADAAAAYYEASGDRLGIVRTRAAQSSVIHMEHNDQVAVAKLRDVLDNAADLPPSTEIAAAQQELARALMLAGQTAESLAWTNRVLEHPEVAAPDVILESLITKGTALSNGGRDVEGEAILRGCVVIADAMGNVLAGLRARNNLRVVLQWQDLEEALALSRDVRDMARKFGVRAWVLHGIASTQDVTFRLGSFEPLSEEELAEIVDSGDFYTAWFELEHSRRDVYRGDPVEAEKQFDRGLTLPAMANSAQATTWNYAAKADARIAQGRFDDAFELALQGEAMSAENELALLAALFAAAGAGDPAKLRVVRDELLAQGLDRVPAGKGYIAGAESLIAALERRWADARAQLATSEQLLEQVGEGLVLGRLRLAFGHLAADHLAEGREAAARADEFWAGHGASEYVAAYRRNATKAARSSTGAELASEATNGSGHATGAPVRTAG